MYVQYGAVDNVYLSDHVYKPIFSSLNMAVFAFYPIARQRVYDAGRCRDAGLEGECSWYGWGPPRMIE